MTKPDIVIFGAGIAGLWTFHRLKSMGYDVLLLEKETIGGGQTIASQGIIHSGLKFILAGKINKLAKSISAMNERWNAALSGTGEIDLSAVKINANSQQLMIPSGFMAGITKLVAKQTLGNSAHNIAKSDWSDDIKHSGFKGSIVHMDEPVLNVPSLIRALAEPYKDSIKKCNDDPFKFLKNNNIEPKQIIFTSAGANHEIAKSTNQDKGLATQKRPLVQGMIKNAPFPLFAHFIGKTDKPVASITTHKMIDGTLIWYIGGGVAERKMDSDPKDVHKAMMKAFKAYLPNIDFFDANWDIVSIERIEGKSKTDSWMPDTPTIHRSENALYCWPTKLTFAPMLTDMILANLEHKNIHPSNKSSNFDFLPECEYSKTPWDRAKWKK